eukprot:UN02351
MTAFVPLLNGIYGLDNNYVNKQFCSPQTATKKANVEEIIHCINGNFEKLLQLVIGSNNLYTKETEKNNNNMTNIDDNIDSVFCSLKNLNENINVLNGRMEKLESNLQDTLIEKLKVYTGKQINSLRFDLELIYGDILKLFDESTKIKKEKNVQLTAEFKVLSYSFDGK